MQKVTVPTDSSHKALETEMQELNFPTKDKDISYPKNKLKKDEIDDVDKELKKNLMFGEKKLVSFESAFT